MRTVIYIGSGTQGIVIGMPIAVALYMRDRYFTLSLLLLLAAFTARADVGSFNQAVDVLNRGIQNAATQPFSVDLALKSLKESEHFRTLFKNYTYSMTGLSLQHGKNPRVIMFGPTGKLIVTFNAKNEEGGIGLETAEFDSVKNEIQFREILFKDEFSADLINDLGGNIRNLRNLSDEKLSDNLTLHASDIAFENEKIAVTNSNPEKCMMCHQVGQNFPGLARYIWEPYNSWPGMYGENDDLLTDQKIPLANFKAAILKDRTPRYRWLDGLDVPDFPYHSDEADYSYIHRPNLRMTKIVVARQAKELAKTFVTAMGAEEIRATKRWYECGGQIGQIPLAKQLSRLDSSAESFLRLQNWVPTTSGIYNSGGNNLLPDNSFVSMIGQEILRLEDPNIFPSVIAANRIELLNDSDAQEMDPDTTNFFAAHFSFAYADNHAALLQRNDCK